MKKLLFRLIVCIFIGNLLVFSPVFFNAGNAVAAETADDEMVSDDQYTADEKSEYDAEQEMADESMNDDEKFLSDEDKGEDTSEE